MLQPLELLRSLERTLDDIAASGNELLQQIGDELHSGSESATHSLRPLDGHGASTQLPRKKLIEAATKLVQLAIRPEEYLDKLANNASPLSSTFSPYDDRLTWTPTVSGNKLCTLACRSGHPPSHSTGRLYLVLQAGRRGWRARRPAQGCVSNGCGQRLPRGAYS